MYKTIVFNLIMALTAGQDLKITVDDEASLCQISAIKDESTKYCGYYGNLTAVGTRSQIYQTIFSVEKLTDGEHEIDFEI